LLAINLALPRLFSYFFDICWQLPTSEHPKITQKICASSGSSRGYKIKTGYSAYGAREVLKEKALGNNESSLFMVHLSK
jgi:hypothetical protein